MCLLLPSEEKEVEIVPADKCFERKQRNVVIAGEGWRNLGMIFFKDGKYYSMLT